jgi:hypothetical protein
VRTAFPEAANELITALDRRWLGWGRRGGVVCPHDGAESVVSVDARGARIARFRPFDFDQRTEEFPVMPPFPAVRLTRDALLAELSRALPEREMERIEQNCARDAEERTVRCPECGRDLLVRATFDGANWTVAALAS